MRNIIRSLVLVVLILIALPFVYSGWQLFFRLGYQVGNGPAGVQQTVCKMVKPQYLKNPEVCE